jgi:hypothetical protein
MVGRVVLISGEIRIAHNGSSGGQIQELNSCRSFWLQDSPGFRTSQPGGTGTSTTRAKPRTETDGFEGTDSEPVLELMGKAMEGKPRLFAVACCRKSPEIRRQPGN